MSFESVSLNVSPRPARIELQHGPRAAHSFYIPCRESVRGDPFTGHGERATRRFSLLDTSIETPQAMPGYPLVR